MNLSDLSLLIGALGMEQVELADIFEKAKRIYQLYDAGQLPEAVQLTLEIEADSGNYSDLREQAICRHYAAPYLIDMGFATRDEPMIRRGIQYFVVWSEQYSQSENQAHQFYNIGNGYTDCWKLHARQHLKDGLDAEDFRQALSYYRRAIAQLQPSHITDGLACLLWTNYGNNLDMVGRCVEAMDAYNIALRINPSMGMALGNKAVALIHVAPFMHGYTHRYYLEVQSLLERALQNQVYPEARQTFVQKLEQVQEIVKAHGEMIAEEMEQINPMNGFHRFLCDFCIQNGLFLNAAALLGDGMLPVYGDPMFMNRMTVPLSEPYRADRYITFLNEIKQDYVLGRYFLVQSQWQSPDLDTVDEGVSLYYPLDYSLHSVYIQLLKAAMKQAISVLDKVAFFIYDYYGLKSPKPNRVSFRELWHENEKMPERMRGDLSIHQNPHSFALFSLSREVSKTGVWNTIYERRDALTHRFLVLHDIRLTDQPNSNIPREQETAFTNQVIQATRIARAAIMYLILLVAFEEEKQSGEQTGIVPPLFATPLDKGFRHRPRFRI